MRFTRRSASHVLDRAGSTSDEGFFIDPEPWGELAARPEKKKGEIPPRDNKRGREEKNLKQAGPRTALPQKSFFSAQW